MKQHKFHLIFAILGTLLLAACSSTEVSQQTPATEKQQVETAAADDKEAIPSFEELGLTQLDDSQSIIHSLTITEQVSDTRLTLAECVERYHIKYYKRFYDDRTEQLDFAHIGYPGYFIYTVIKTEQGYSFLRFSDVTDYIRFPAFEEIRFCDDSTEDVIKTLKPGDTVSMVKKIDPYNTGYTVGRTGRTDYPHTSFHYYRRGVFYVIRYKETGEVIDNVMYTL